MWTCLKCGGAMWRDGMTVLWCTECGEGRVLAVVDRLPWERDTPECN